MEDLPYGLKRREVESLLSGGDPASVALEIRTVTAGPEGATIRWAMVDEGGDYVRDDQGRLASVESVVPFLPISVRPGTTLRFSDGQWTPSNVL